MDILKRHAPWVIAFTLAVCIVLGYEATIAPPRAFSPGTEVRIAHGSSTPEIAAGLARAQVIKHPVLFRALLRLTGTGDVVQTGMYRFDAPQNLFIVAHRLISGIYGISPARLTFIEGYTLREASGQVAAALRGISASDFLAASQGQEGYLFPDTYFFQPGIEAKDVVARMRANFDKRTASLVLPPGRMLADVVTMASLIEKEARTPEDKRIVAGILWNRIRLDMPLQVDAVFGYIFGRATYSPSPADLQVKSPYNTYAHRGLPPGPINNPGLDSLDAAANPAQTNYLYYLTGNDGLMHYATTYAGHQTNLRKYLR